MFTSVPVFRDRFLSTAANYSATAISDPVQAQGNKVVASTLLQNITSSATLDVVLEGSYDGNTWQTIASNTGITSFGSYEVTGSSLAYPLVRLRLALANSGAGTDQKAIVDAAFGFSQQ